MKFLKLRFLIMGVTTIAAAGAFLVIRENTGDPARALPRDEEKAVSVSLLFVGDVMLDRNVSLLSKKAGDLDYPFQNIKDQLLNYDTVGLRIANLEGTVTSNRSVANGEGYQRFMFTFPYDAIDNLPFDNVSLANNHSRDFGRAGYLETMKNLKIAGINYFGDHQNKENLSLVNNYHGVKIANIGYHALVEKGKENIIAEIKKVRQAGADFVIIYPHWGVEYELTEHPAQSEAAHQFIDAGADLIIGSHPHVVQPIEIYKNKVIFYSLGNFVFDQYWSEETMRGLAVRLELEKKPDAFKQSFTLYPVFIPKTSQPELADETLRRTMLERLSRDSTIDDALRPTIAAGEFSI